MDVAGLRASVAELTTRSASKRREIGAKRQMFLDWKRAVSDGWKLNKDEIEAEINDVINKLKEISEHVTKET